MEKHEPMICPRCGAGFVCKAGNITECQCYGVQTTVEEDSYIASHYPNQCLCRQCLIELKSRYRLFVEQPELFKQR